MLVGLLGRQLALAHELLDERMVVGQALEGPVAQAVEPAVAHVGDGEVVLADVGDGERRAHAGPRVVGLGGRHDPRVGLADTRAQALLDRPAAVGQALLEDLDGQVRGDLAGLGAAHPVGHREERRAGVEGVLVPTALAAGVGALEVLGDAQHHRSA